MPEVKDRVRDRRPAERLRKRLRGVFDRLRLGFSRLTRRPERDKDEDKDERRLAAFHAARNIPLRTPPPSPPVSDADFAPPSAPPTELLAPPPLRPVDVYVLALRGPMSRARRRALARAGATLLSHHGQLCFAVRVPLDRLSAVLGLDFVASARPYDVRETVDAAMFAMRATFADKTPPSYEAIAHEVQGVEEIIDWLRTRDVGADLVAGRKIRVADVGQGTLIGLARHPEVATLYRFAAPRPCNDYARQIVGIDRAAPAPALPWTGRGQSVGVADSGLDVAHPDIEAIRAAGRLADPIARARPGDASDLTGHGTHVTGTVAGAGTASNGALRGMAPEARVVFQSIMDQAREFVTDPSVADVLQEAYDRGVRVHCDSWGVEYNGSAYPAQSLEVDEFVAAHPDMLVVTAAGNDATAANAADAVAPRSIAAPGTAKNALTVGASRSTREPVGVPPLTWGEWWPGRFPSPGIGDELLSGDADRLALFSGRGPFEDQLRIKPDLVAPGTFILSSCAGGVPPGRWGAGPSLEYVYDGGTSMATAVVAGTALLVRQFLEENNGHQASAALLKAILVNGARWLEGPDAQGPPPGSPNFHQGFGRVSLRHSIPIPGDAPMGFTFVDAWTDASMEIADSKRGWKWTLRTEAGTPLRLALAWTDPARSPRGVVENSLELSVRHSDTGANWSGNAGRPQLIEAPVDLANNVQAIRIDAAPGGEYTVRVKGTNVSWPRQRFALVVTGSPAIELVDGREFR